MRQSQIATPLLYPASKRHLSHRGSLRLSLPHLIAHFFAPSLYHLKECPISGASSDLIDLISYLLAAIQQLLAFIGTIAAFGSDKIAAICRGDAAALDNSATIPPDYQQPVVQLAESAQIKLCQLVGLLLEIRDYLQCDNWLPLYTMTVWEGMCVNGTDGFLWYVQNCIRDRPLATFASFEIFDSLFLTLFLTLDNLVILIPSLVR